MALNTAGPEDTHSACVGSCLCPDSIISFLRRVSPLPGHDLIVIAAHMKKSRRRSKVRVLFTEYVVTYFGHRSICLDYEMLGVNQDASEEEIKVVWRKLALNSTQTCTSLAL